MLSVMLATAFGAAVVFTVSRRTAGATPAPAAPALPVEAEAEVEAELGAPVVAVGGAVAPAERPAPVRGAASRSSAPAAAQTAPATVRRPPEVVTTERERRAVDIYRRPPKLGRRG